MFGRPDEALLAELLASLAHRGPDGAGTYVAAGGSPALGHRRLAIMDPEGGAQPIRSGDGRRALVANGEIYNYPALRPALARGHRLRSASDSEAILHLYEEHGAGVVDHLDGMWAFVISDGDRLFAARDPVGIKPLYVGDRDGTLVFASELKALAGRAANVREFPPGALYDSRTGWLRHYRVPDPPEDDQPAAVWAARVRNALERCVAKQRMADVPVGAFLSGGLDSSVLAALLSRHVDELHTFSVGLPGSADLRAACTVAEHIGSVHHEHVIAPEEIAACLPDVVRQLESFDQDLVRSAVPTWLTARLAARHVKVVLTGEGADELFAGYAYHRQIRDPQTLRRELRRSVTALHAVNLQRVDRMTMAHSLEGRPPFVDPELIDLAGRVPVALKLSGGGPEKWILRTAFEDLLPDEIVWRAKAQFDEGSGVAGVAAEVAATAMDETAAAAHRRRFPGVRLRSAEECWYHRLLVEAYDGAAAVLGNVARWTDRTAEAPV